MIQNCEASTTASALRDEESRRCYDSHNHEEWCLTGAEAAAILGALPLSTRAFGRVPLTGEVDKPRRKERAPVSPEDINEQFADQQPRCEIAKTLIAEGECQSLGEVQLDRSVLCVAHAELLRLGNAPKPCSAKCSRWMSGWRASTVRPTNCACGEQSTIETNS